MPIAFAYPEAKHHTYDSFADDYSNNVLESFNKTFKAWYKISNFMFYYNFIHSHSSLSKQSPACVAGITYSQEQAKHWFLF